MLVRSAFSGCMNASRLSSSMLRSAAAVRGASLVLRQPCSFPSFKNSSHALLSTHAPAATPASSYTELAQSAVITIVELPSHNIRKSQDFVQHVLGCKPWHDLKTDTQAITVRCFNQILLYKLMPVEQCEAYASVNMKPFSLTFRKMADLEGLYSQIQQSGWDIEKTLRVRQAGKPDEQHYFIIRDPSRNKFEFSHFTNPDVAYSIVPREVHYVQHRLPPIDR